MDKYIKLLGIFLLCLCISLNKAQAEEILTWEDCVQEARQNHPDLISAEEELNQAIATKAITKSGSLPQISSGLSGKTAKAATGVTSDTYAYDISIEQLLYDGFKTAYGVASAAEDIKSAQYNYAVTSSNVRLSLRSAFAKLLKARECLQITEDIAGRRKQNLELVELRYEAGREHQGSLLNAQADFAQAEHEVVQAKRDIELAQRRLNKELGRTKFMPVKVKRDFEIKYANRRKPDFEGLAKSNPFLLELITKKEAARFDLKSAQADFFPQVYANASTGKSDSHWPPDNEVWSAGLSLSLPVFEGGSRIAEVSKARSALNQAQADERSGRDSVILILEETWKELQDTIDNVQVQQKFLAAAQERAKITQAQYSSGLISFDNWTIIEDDLVSAKKSHLDAQTDALIAEADWIQAQGGTLDYE